MAVTDSEIPGVTLSGGALAVGALVAAILEGKKIFELSGKIHAETETQMMGVLSAASEISTLVDNYDILYTKFEFLNAFWRATSSDANSLGHFEDAIAENIGRELLVDEASITSAMQTMSSLGGACKKYLDTLHKQGVTPAVIHHGVSAHLLFHKAGHGQAHVKHSHHGQSAAHRTNSALKSASMQKDLLETFHRHIHDAQGKLKAHDHHGYVSVMNQARFVSFVTIASAADVDVVGGHWFDVPLLSWNASIWNGYLAPIPVGLVEGPAKDELSNAQRRLNGSLNETKPLVVSMLKDVVHLGKTFRRWKAKFPQPPVSTGRVNAELEKLKKESLEQCKAAEEIAAKAYSKFSVFERHAMKWQRDRESEIAECQAAIKTAEDSGNHAKAARLEDTMSKLRELQHSGNAFHRSAHTWIRMCEQVGEMLGGHIHNILTGLTHTNDDQTLYDALMGTNWNKIGNDASSLLDILDAHTSQHAASNGTAVLERSISTVSKANQISLVRSLCPEETLGKVLKSQAESAKKVHDAVNAITQLPATGLIAYWDDHKETKTALVEVAHHMRDQYVQLMATEYDVVEKLYTLSIMQAIRAFNYAEQGKIPLDALIKVSFQSFSAAYDVANRAVIEYAKSASEFDLACASAEGNLHDLHEKVKHAGIDIKNLDEHKKDAVYSSIADAIAASVSSPMAFAAPGVASSVTQALVQSTKMGLGAHATADNLKLVIRELKPAELTQLVHALEQVGEHCGSTAKQLAAVAPLFRKVVEGLQQVSHSLLESSNNLHRLLQRATLPGAVGTITTDDATRIETEWKKLGGDARIWMDAIDSQNISHVTFSVHSA